MKKCVFSGTFDPPTVGHLSVIEKCLQIFDGVVVAVMVNPDKTPLLTMDERILLLNKLFDNDKRVEIITFDGAAVDLLRKVNTPFYVRGVRNTVDFEYENANHFASKKLYGEIVTIYIPAEQEVLNISSSLVKNSVKFKKDYKSYIPDKIFDTLLKILEQKNV